jgi:radical SAM protein with 4Fe4S-binding SPASM domain
LLNGEKPKGLRCGAGHSGYAISTSGKVVHCPIMNNIESFKAGTIESNPDELKKFDCKDECRNCEVYDLCGGRCMYWRKAKLWPEIGDEMICDSIKFYINAIKEKMLEIKESIKLGFVKEKDFLYEDYFGPEIIP